MAQVNVTRVGTKSGDVTSFTVTVGPNGEGIDGLHYKYKWTAYMQAHSETCEDATKILGMDTFVATADADSVPAYKLKADRANTDNWRTCIVCLANEEGRRIGLQKNENLRMFVDVVYMYRAFHNSFTGDAAYASLTGPDYDRMGLPVPATKCTRDGDDTDTRTVCQLQNSWGKDFSPR